MNLRSVIRRCVLPPLLGLALLLPGTAYADVPELPDYSGEGAVELNENRPDFLPEDMSAADFISYSPLDELDRPGQAFACLSRASLPAETDTEEIDFVPVGWHDNNPLGGPFVYSLCHVLSPSLGGDGTAPENVFTGTRHLREEELRPFETLIADYLRRSANHVLYRVTPVYRDDELVPFGIQLEAYSVEDAGRSICYNVFLYNIQPGFSMDYLDGESWESALAEPEVTAETLIGARGFQPLPEMEPPQYSSFSVISAEYKKAAEARAAAEAKAAAEAAAEAARAAAEAEAAAAEAEAEAEAEDGSRTVYIPEEDVGIYHLIPDCSSMGAGRVRRTSEETAISLGYVLCDGDCAEYA